MITSSESVRGSLSKIFWYCSAPSPLRSLVFANCSFFPNFLYVLTPEQVPYNSL